MDSFDKNNNNYENSEKEQFLGINSYSDENNIVNNYKIEKQQHKKNNRSLLKTFRKICLITISSIICGSIIGFGIGAAIPKVQKYIENKKNTVNYAEASVLSSEDTEKDKNKDNENIDGISGIIKRVQPAVVSINSVISSRDLFSMPVESTNIGSGIIFHQTSSNVYIMTNYHVIYSASDVSVSVNGSNVVPASLVGKNSTEDLAVISVSKSDLSEVGIDSVTIARFGNSDLLNVGDGVIAIGNALGNGDTATKGIISALQKDLQFGGTDISVLQTDAAINLGNDGGALVNGRGEVIGINTSKYSGTTVEGVGYAIPSNTAKSVVEQLVNKTDSPCLGIQVSAISNQGLDYTDNENLFEAGVLVEDVQGGGAAALAGIRPGDIITGFNDIPIFNPKQLVEAIQKCNVGDEVKIKFIRSNSSSQRVVSTDVTLQANKDTSF